MAQPVLSPPPSSNRTGRFSASGFPDGFMRKLSQGQPRVARNQGHWSDAATRSSLPVVGRDVGFAVACALSAIGSPCCSLSIPSAGVRRSAGITRLPRYHDPLRLPPMQPSRLCIPETLMGTTPASTDLSGSSTVLSIRAVRSHPGGSDDCTCLGLRRPCWLHHLWQVGHPRSSWRGRNRFTLAHCGSHRSPLWAPPRRFARSQRQIGYMFTGIYMIEPFIR